jgi:hypothetical protein
VVAPALALHHTGKQTKIRNDAPASQHFHGGQRRGEERRGEDRQNPSVSLQIHRNRFMVSTEVFSSTLRKNGAATKCQSLTCKRHAPCTSGGGLELRSMRGGLLGDLPFHRHHRYTTASVLPPTTNDLPPCSRKCNETKQGGRPDDGSRRQHGWLAIQ